MDEQEKKQSSNYSHSAKSGAAGKGERSQPHRVSIKDDPSTRVEAAMLEEKQQELEKTCAQAAANLDGWQRERAEFSNFKRRIEREQAQQHQVLTGEIIKKYLVILDDLELALKNKPKDGDGAAWAEGITLIARKLQSVIEAENVERICENNVPFDPNLHEAISNEENAEFESGYVIEVVRQGYKLGERILRPAMVRVAR
jgi:molecular chaperone GrpE